MQRVFRIILDILLTALLPVVACYMFTGRLWHEWLGTVMAVGLMVHHGLNRRWFGSLWRGRYTIPRALNTLVDILLLADLLFLLVSGVFLSKYAFGWTGLRDLRILEMHEVHNCAGYWALLLMGLHLGQHTPQLFGMMRLHKLPAALRITFHYIVLAIAAYGVYFFVQEDLTANLLREAHFSLTDTTPAEFQLGLTCVMLAAAMFGHALNKCFSKSR